MPKTSKVPKMQVKNIKSAIIAKSAKTIKSTKYISKIQIYVTFSSVKIHKNESTKKVDYFWTENIVLSQCVSCKGSRLRKRLYLEHQDCPEGHFPKLNFILKVKRERV